MRRIVDHFKNEEPAPTMTELSVALKLPSRLVSELLRKLEDAGIIVEIIPSQGERQIAYGPAFDIDKMTVSCIVGKLDKHGTSDFHFEETEDYSKLRSIVNAFGVKQSEMNENVLLRDL
jgi:membrane protein